MSTFCTICNRTCKSAAGLIQHTENVHGRGGVHRGVLTWEKSRNQVGEITTGRAVYDTQYQVDDSFYDDDYNVWECPQCSRTFSTQRSLEQHLESGTHEEARYDCKECYRKFSSLTALTQHLTSSGHADREERLVHTVIADARRQGQLMITDGHPRLEFEATLQFDGSAKPNPGSGGAGWWIYDNIRRRTLCESGAAVPYYSVTNNEAEYYGLVQGLNAAKKLGIKRLLVKGDSELVIKQMNGQYAVSAANLIGLHNLAKELTRYFQICEFQHIPRSENTVADELANQHCPQPARSFAVY